MLLLNFQVGSKILNNVVKNSFSVSRFSKKMSKNGKFINWSENKIDLTPVEYQKRLKQCPKPSVAQLCCKKLFSKPKLKKCDTTTASDDYLKARQLLKPRIEDLVKFVEDKSQSIANDVESSLKSSKAAHAIQMEKLFRATSGKLDELIKLDVSYGSWMRKETLMLNDEIRRSFEALERAIAPNAKRIIDMLRNLQSDMSMLVERAEKNVTTCRRHNVPSNLTECVKKQLDETTKMLDQMDEEARRKLEEIAKFRETVMKAHEMTTREVTEVNRKKVDELVKYLERCIAQLKRANSKNRMKLNELLKKL